MLQHAVEQIEIDLNRNLGEDIAGHELHACRNAERRKQRLGGFDGVRVVEQHPFELRMRVQQSSEQPAIAAADIGKALHARYIQRSDDGPGLRQRLFRQVGVEQSALPRILRAPVKHAHAEALFEGRFAGLEAADDIGPGPPILPDDDLNFLRQPRGGARAQRLAFRRQRDRAVRKLLANADATQPAQEAGQMRRRYTKRLGQLFARRRACREPVGQVELHRGIDQRRLVIGIDLPAQPVLERRLIYHRERQSC